MPTFAAKRADLKTKQEALEKAAREHWNTAAELAQQIQWLTIAEAVEVILVPGVDMDLVRRQAYWANKEEGYRLNPEELEDLIVQVCAAKHEIEGNPSK